MKLLDKIEISRLKIDSLFYIEQSENFLGMQHLGNRHYILVSPGIQDYYIEQYYLFYVYNVTDNMFDRFTIPYHIISKQKFKIYLVADGDVFPIAKSKQ